MDLIVRPARRLCSCRQCRPDYPDDLLLAIYRETRTIAMVGASPNWNRPSYFVMRYLQRKGFRVIPVNPRALDAPILGERVYPDLESVPVPVDVVDVFRRPEETPGDRPVRRGDRGQGPVAPARDPQRRGGDDRRRRRADGHRGPLHEDRVRPARRRAGLERDQHPDHLEPPPAARSDDRPSSGGTRRPARAPPPPIDEAYGFATRAVHAGARPDPVTGSRNVPIHQTTSYVFDDVDHAAALFNLQTFGYIYSRLTNPTVAALEERVAALEGGRGAVAAASGHAAQLLAFYTLLEPGDDIVAARQLYGGSLTQFRHTFRRLGWSASFVDAADPDAFRGRSGRGRRRSSSSRWPTRAASSSTSRRSPRSRTRRRIPLVVDNTMATPYLCRPFEWGADLVVHSLTKFLSGHGTSMGGVVVESGPVRLGGERQVPVPRRPGSRLPRPRLHRDVRRLRVLDEGARRRAARPRAGPVADERVPDPDRDRDAAAADGAARRERAGGRRVPRRHTRPSPGSRTRGCRRARRTRWRRATCRAARARSSRSACGAASRPGSAPSSRSTSGRTSPTSATRAA